MYFYYWFQTVFFASLLLFLRVYWVTVMTIAEAHFLGLLCMCICPYACANAINMF